MLLAVSPGALAAEAAAGGALTCEQIYAVAQATVRYRDQGHSLDQVLGGLRGLEDQNKLSAQEVEVLRRAVSVSYMGTAAPEEIALDCVQGRKNK